MLTVNPSERLTYRRITARDRDFLFDIDQDEEVMRYLTGGRKTTRKEVDEVFIPRIESFNNEEKGWGLWQASLSTGTRE
ncbi:MAG TPA: N-acetyltransferase, partial [Alteromonas sp.]|nr:N-acetyltransferase [Alteromonas sp.]